MISALYVATNGPYFNLEDVDPWDEIRDARSYAGPNPVVAHPPCQRWGRYATGGPNPKARRYAIGDDGGCFTAALSAVRKYGGVLEHPEATHAYAAHGMAKPPRSGGWVKVDDWGYACCVEQGHYGHLARKATWIYAVGCELPELKWGPSKAGIRIDEGFRSADHARQVRAERKRLRDLGEFPERHLPIERLSLKQRIHTPPEFRDLLIAIAKTAKVAI